MNDEREYLHKRLDRLEDKIDLLLSRYWFFWGVSTVVVTVVTFIINHFLK